MDDDIYPFVARVKWRVTVSKRTKTVNHVMRERQTAKGVKGKVRSIALKHFRLPLLCVCGTTQGQFRDFQIHFVKPSFGSPGKVVDLAHTK